MWQPLHLFNVEVNYAVSLNDQPRGTSAIDINEFFGPQLRLEHECSFVFFSGFSDEPA